jgi:hypothetical protein
MQQHIQNNTKETVMKSPIKTHYRDLRPPKSERMGYLNVIIETLCRTRFPIPVDSYGNVSSCPSAAFENGFSGKVNANGAVSWGKAVIGDPTHELNGWPAFYAACNNMTLPKALCELAQMYNLNFDNPLEVSKFDMIGLMNNNFNEPLVEVAYDIDGELARCEEILHIKQPHKGTLYLLAIIATQSGKAMHLPLYRINTERSASNCWGFYPHDIPISELDMLEKHQKAKVIVTDDAWVAHQINIMLGYLGYKGLVATSIWAGTNRIAKYDYVPLQGRHIVYVPTLHRDAIIAGLELRDKLIDEGVADFRFVLRPFANGSDMVEQTRRECGDTACDYALIVSRREILCLLDDITNAWDFKRYKRYCEEEGFTQTEQPVEMKPQFFNSTARLGAEGNNGTAIASLNFDQLLAPEHITVVAGDSDAGKSLFAKTLAVAIAEGVEAFTIKAGTKRPVCIINLEQSQEGASAYSARACAALGLTNTPENLQERAERSAEPVEGLPPFDLDDRRWQDFIKDQVTPGCVLILDNLLSGTTKGVSHARSPQSLVRFADELRNSGVSLVVVHHLGKDGTPMGSTALESLAQNLILIYREDIAEGYEGGVNARLVFKKIKSYPPYRDKEFDLRLPYAEEGDKGGPWVFEDRNGKGQIEVGPQDIQAPNVDRPNVAGMSPVRRDAIIQAHKSGRVAKKDLVKNGYKGATAKDNLSALVNEGFLIRNGSGKSTYYTLSDKATR